MKKVQLPEEITINMVNMLKNSGKLGESYALSSMWKEWNKAQRQKDKKEAKKHYNKICNFLRKLDMEQPKNE